MKKDNEFYSSNDEYIQVQHIDEFHRDSEEYFGEQKYTETKTGRKSNKRRIERISKIVVSAACIVVTAASVHISYPNDNSVVNAADLELTADDTENSVMEIEASARESKSSIINEEPLIMSENQKAFIRSVWESFEVDDIDTLENLLHKEVFEELCQGGFQNMVFNNVNMDIEYEKRNNYSGKGLILLKTEDYKYNTYLMSCADFTAGTATGNGKIITSSWLKSSGVHDRGDSDIDREYYSGNLEQDYASGEGILQLSFEDTDRTDGYVDHEHFIQNDIVQGIFKVGELVTGNVNKSIVYTGKRLYPMPGENEDYSTRVDIEQTIENGICINEKYSETDLLTGEVYSTEDEMPHGVGYYYIDGLYEDENGY